MQDKDVGQVLPSDLKVVTKRAPSPQELSDMLFAWKVAKHVKSNAIVYVKDGATVGIGAGQMSRVDSTRIAARKAQDMAEVLGLDAPLTQGSVVASDAFFPFRGWPYYSRRGGRYGAYSAGWFDARCRGNSRSRCGWPRNGIYWNEAF